MTTIRPQASYEDSVFIKHIQSHLSEKDVVICKICGLSAEAIVSLDEDVSISKEVIKRIINNRRRIECECNMTDSCANCYLYDDLLQELKLNDKRRRK